MKRCAAFVLCICVSLAFGAGPTTAFAEPAKGHPKVTLDRLELPETGGVDEPFLRKVLAREARHADWGAGRENHIEYRFRIDDLTVTEERGVLRVACSASGWLPKSPRAKSHLAFGGDPKDREKVVRHVVEIVATGVMTRLADMERKRRSEK
jgi:hypothetical protein